MSGDGRPSVGRVAQSGDALDFTLIAVTAFAMFAGGLLKGAIGFGFPLVVLPILAFMLPPPVAMSLVAVPIIATNIVQALQGGAWRAAFVRFWPLFLATFAGLAIGLQLLSRADGPELKILIGITISAIGLMQLFGVTLPRPHAERERAASAGIGFVAGVLGGMTSLFGPPVIVYMVALRLEKNALVGTLSTYYLVASVPFFGSLAALGILGTTEFIASAASLVPVAIGMVAGTLVRQRIAPEPFRRVVLVALTAIGITMVAKALGDF